jgi:phosphohistidine phosphatase
MGRGYRAEHTLVLVRHAKSDWSANAPDLERPLNKRGKRQAPESGQWLAEHLQPIELAVVSPAQRARSTWDLVAAELSDPPPITVDERAYTFDARGLLPIIHELSDDLGTVALVGHNPAMEELASQLTGAWVAMPTSCVAVIGLPGPWSEAGPSGTLLAHGRPPGEAPA